MTYCKQRSVSLFDSLTDFLFENETRSEKSCLSAWACFFTQCKTTESQSNGKSFLHYGRIS